MKAALYSVMVCNFFFFSQLWLCAFFLDSVAAQEIPRTWLFILDLTSIRATIRTCRALDTSHLPQLTVVGCEP